MEQTLYKFFCNSDAFPRALDIFSQFFKQPLFNEDAISREINAVDAEDSKNRIIDFRRMLQVLKYLTSSQNLYYKYSTGNLFTLAYNDVAEYNSMLSKEIKDFHGKYYRPEEMALCLCGPQSLTELKRLCEECFSDVNNIFGFKSDGNLPESNSKAFPEGETTLVKIRPTRDLRDITLIWEMPYDKEVMLKKDPSVLFSYIISHKGENSLFSLLQVSLFVKARNKLGSSLSSFVL